MDIKASGFRGAAKRIDDIDIPMLAHRLRVGEDELHAIMEVEAPGSGFDSHGRPKMLFEPHVFYRCIKDPAARARAVAVGLAYEKWGEKKYPSDSYPRLTDAMVIDPEAALMACSIGKTQVLVENFSSLGYRSPQHMWQSFMNDEQEHIEAMVRFILVNGIADDLRAHRWEAVARVWNGPGYRKHGYHTRLAAAFKKWQAIADTVWAPDGTEEGAGGLSQAALKTVQKRLRELGYVETGSPDGTWGTKTRAAVLAFRADNGLPIVPVIDDVFMAATVKAQYRGIAESRASTTEAELRESGSRTIKAADKTDAAGAAVTVVGVVGGISAGLGGITDKIGFAQGLLEQIGPLLDTARLLGPWGLGALGLFIAYQQWQIKKARVEDHRTGTHAGPV